MRTPRAIFALGGFARDLEDDMGKRGPLKSRRLTGGAWLEAKAKADAARRGEDLDQLLVMPVGLTSGAKRRWQTLAPLLLRDGRLRADTREALVTFVRLADEADVLGEQLTAEGVVLTTPHGAIANPKAKVVAGIRSAMLRFSAALGLDPSSKARLEAAGSLEREPARTADEDALDDILLR
jgi:P27 family predicted phage terminase small subunit